MPEIIIVTGKINSGKSTRLQELVAKERTLGQIPTGIIAVGFYKSGEKIGYDVIDIASGKSMALARISPFPDTEIRMGKYYFSKTAFESAKQALLNFQPGGIVFLDEAGPLELAGQGYAECLMMLLKSDISKLYIVIRKELVADFTKNIFGGHRITVIEV